MSEQESTKITEEMSHKIGFQMYGVSLNLNCNYPELAEYVACLLPGLSGSPHELPDLEVNARWIAESSKRGVSVFPESSELNRIGKRMQLSKDELVWFNTHRDKDLQLRFRRKDNKLIFDVAYCFQPSKKKQDKYPDFKYKKFFDLTRYLVFFPIAWYLERTRGWTLIHASAVADGDRAIMIAGPGGAGKTTTCVGLIAQTNMKLLTENLLFYDGTRIFPVIEPLRLTADSLTLLDEDLKGLEPIELPGGLKDKTMYWLPEGQIIKAAKPVMIFIPQFSNNGFVRPISPGIACEQIGAANYLTLELNDFYWYTAALNLLWPEPGNAQKQLNVLKDLTTTAPCYSLGIDRSAGVQAVVDQILHCMYKSKNILEEVEL